MIKYSQIVNWYNGYECNNYDQFLLTKKFNYNNLNLKCGNCNSRFSLKNYPYASVMGVQNDQTAIIYFAIAGCPSCNWITVNILETGYPRSLILNPDIKSELLNKIKEPYLKQLFEEFSNCFTLGLNSAFTLLARKILMHIAVSEGADKNKSFKYYAEYINSENLLGKKWDKHIVAIEELGNSENHEIKIASTEELKLVKAIIIKLLENIYEPETF